MTSRFGAGIFAAWLLLVAGDASADRFRIAVASNFAAAAEALAAQYAVESGHEPVLSAGSTGKQYAQIRHGAPFDLFFAADAERPRLLDEAGDAVPGSRFTYALGKLVLWSPRPDYVDAEGKVLEQDAFTHLSIANPDLAPYGAAARQVLRARGLWDSMAGRLVLGENIAQAFQFVSTGNAELGFVALSQVTGPEGDRPGSRWEVPTGLYTPIEQQVVLLHDTPAARGFMAFVQSDAGRAIIRSYGYDNP